MLLSALIVFLYRFFYTIYFLFNVFLLNIQIHASMKAKIKLSWTNSIFYVRYTPWHGSDSQYKKNVWSHEFFCAFYFVELNCLFQFFSSFLFFAKIFSYTFLFLVIIHPFDDEDHDDDSTFTMWKVEWNERDISFNPNVIVSVSQFMWESP